MGKYSRKKHPLVFLIKPSCARLVFFLSLAVMGPFCRLHADPMEPVTLKNVHEAFEQLKRESYFEATGKDEDIRPLFIAIQAMMEEKITSHLGKTIKTVIGCTHTPMPATPFCMQQGMLDSTSLIHPSIKANAMILGSMHLRMKCLKEYLSKGGVMLVVYPKDGLKKRSQEEQALYQKNLQTFQRNLLDRPLDEEVIEKELIGATYILENDVGDRALFSIKMTQANDPQENADFALWFGQLEDPMIQERWKKVRPFFIRHPTKAFS